MLIALLAGSPAAAQSMRHEAAGRGRKGCVVAAPHGGYDLHTEQIAPKLAEALGWGLVIAEGYRSKAEQRWFDVNRPTQRVWARGELAKGEETLEGHRVFTKYREALFAAGRASPLELLVEIHGHARKERIGGERVVVQVIELAHQGIPRDTLRALAARYQTLIAELPADRRVPLAIEGLDPSYVYRGRELEFHYRASGAKARGALAPRVSKRALHVELPPRARSKANRAAYGKLLAELLAPLVEGE